MRTVLICLALAACAATPRPEVPQPAKVATGCPVGDPDIPLPPIVSAEQLRANRDATLEALHRTRRALADCERRVKRNAAMVRALER